jgi:hypothetical protein
VAGGCGPSRRFRSLWITLLSICLMAFQVYLEGEGTVPPLLAASPLPASARAVDVRNATRLDPSLLPFGTAASSSADGSGGGAMAACALEAARVQQVASVILDRPAAAAARPARTYPALRPFVGAGPSNAPLDPAVVSSAEGAHPASNLLRRSCNPLRRSCGPSICMMCSLLTAVRARVPVCVCRVDASILSLHSVS